MRTDDPTPFSTPTGFQDATGRKIRPDQRDRLPEIVTIPDVRGDWAAPLVVHVAALAAAPPHRGVHGRHGEDHVHGGVVGHQEQRAGHRLRAGGDGGEGGVLFGRGAGGGGRRRRQSRRRWLRSSRCRV